MIDNARSPEEYWSVSTINDLLLAARLDGWRPLDAPFFGQIALRNDREQLTVLLSAAVYDDQRRWVHFSMSGRHSLPSWDQLSRAKDALLGAERKALQVLPPRSQWVNIHPNCLHLWMCLDDDGLPDFTEGSGSI